MNIAPWPFTADTRGRRFASAVPVTAERLKRAKGSYAARRVPLAQATGLVADPGISPNAGDALLARVTRVGQHSGLQNAGGRRASLYVGDEIIVCYGNRYAPDQFEGLVPEHLGPCHLVAGGGIAAEVRRAHARMSRPTDIEPIGLLADANGCILNLAQFRIHEDSAITAIGVPVIAVAGASMNSGKTTSAAWLVRGLISSGLSVAAAKVTGTGACGDTMMLIDAGASPVIDFTDFGYASTYRVAAAEIEKILRRTVNHLTRQGPGVIVIEIADGLYQDETAALLKSNAFRRLVSGVVYAAPDALSAAAGVDWLEQRGLPVVAVSGAVTASPLSADEAARATQLPVLSLEQLSNSEIARKLLAELRLRAEPGQSR